MTATLLGLSAAYVLVALLLLLVLLRARLNWRFKAAIIVVTSGFFIAAFFSSRGLLGWPATDQVPTRFQLLWVRVVEPDAKSAEKGAVYLWAEEIDANNVPSGLPRAYRRPYSRSFADRALAARDQIMEGNAQLGTAEELGDPNTPAASQAEAPLVAGNPLESPSPNLEIDPLLQQPQRIQFAPMVLPLLPPKN
jgi:hypothetical protein